MSCNSVLVKSQYELTEFYEPVFLEEGILTDLDVSGCWSLSRRSVSGNNTDLSRAVQNFLKSIVTL